MTMKYDPTTDPDTKPWGEGLVAGRQPVSDETSRQRRERCLALAVDALKAGSDYGQSPLKVADRFYRFACGEPVAQIEGSNESLTFADRVALLIKEFIATERSDDDRIIHDLELIHADLCQKVIEARYPLPVANGDASAHDGATFGEKLA